MKKAANKKRLLIFASGSPSGGGSGFENLVIAARENRLWAHIVGVVSHYQGGGVEERAKRLGIPFHYMEKTDSAEDYREVVALFKPDFIALSGWMKLTKGLNPRTTINIHPGLLPYYGGKGMYGHYVHEAVFANKEKESAVSMHFVTSEYDKGPVFFQSMVDIKKAKSPEDIGRLVNQREHIWQPRITSMVINGQISWNGWDTSSLKVPKDYPYLPNSSRNKRAKARRSRWKREKQALTDQ